MGILDAINPLNIITAPFDKIVGGAANLQAGVRDAKMAAAEAAKAETGLEQARTVREEQKYRQTDEKLAAASDNTMDDLILTFRKSLPWLLAVVGIIILVVVLKQAKD